MFFNKTKKTDHYKKYHEKEVPWHVVLKIIFTAKRKKKGNNFIEFKSKTYYVLGKIDKGILKIINAKKLIR